MDQGQHFKNRFGLVLSKIEQMAERVKASAREVDALKMKLATAAGGDLLDDVVEVAEAVSVASLDGW